MVLCKYGCGKEAKFLSRGRNPCCSPHQSQCDAVRLKLSLLNKKLEKQQCQFCQGLFSKHVILRHEASCKLNPIQNKPKDKICEVCGDLHDGSLGSGRFCSRKCSNRFSSSVNLAERCAKLSKTRSLTRKSFDRICLWCNHNFNTAKLTQKFCSRSCSGYFNSNKNIESIRECFRKSAISRYAIGDETIGWQRRSDSSYPERYFETVFKSKGYIFEREVKIGKWFADFLFREKKLIIEVDGRQHNDVERKNSDIAKDDFLKEQGFRIMRIKWTSPKTVKGKCYIQKCIEEIDAAIV